MKIIFKVGPVDARRSSKGGFQATDNPATAAKEISDTALYAIRNKADTLTEDILKQKVKAIQEQIVADLDKYAGQTLDFFFNQKSTEGSILFISMNRFAEGQRSLGFTTGDINTKEKANNITLRWLPLSPRTIKNKKGNRTYFVHEGQLLTYMQEDLAKSLRIILHPKVTFTPVNKITAASGEIKVISPANITVSLLAGKRGRTLGDLPFLKSLNPGETLNDLIARPPTGNNLLRMFMNDVVSRKLNNIGRGNRPVRPMFTPIIGYWVLSRFPIIAERSFKNSIGKLK